jgi:hypothetical protein
LVNTELVCELSSPIGMATCLSVFEAGMFMSDQLFRRGSPLMDDVSAVVNSAYCRVFLFFGALEVREGSVLIVHVCEADVVESQ